MVKWFCDVCSEEILDNPVRIAAYRCVKDRSDADIGWGESDYFFKQFCHKNCASVLEERIRKAVQP